MVKQNFFFNSDWSTIFAIHINHTIIRKIRTGWIRSHIISVVCVKTGWIRSPIIFEHVWMTIRPSEGRPTRANTSSIVGVMDPFGKTKALIEGD